MKRAYRYRFYPTDEQREMLARTFGCVRYVYNWALRRRTDAYRDEGVPLGFAALCAELTQLKRGEDAPWLGDVSSVPLQQGLRQQQRAFANFFEKRAAYPRYRRKRGKQSAAYTKSGFRWDGERLFLAKMREPLDIRWSRPLGGEPTSLTVSKDSAGRYFASVLCATPEPDPLPTTEKTAGVDVGLNDLAVTSDGIRSGAPRSLKHGLRRLKRAQQALCRKQKGSKNRAKARLRVARIHARIADKRNDFSHRLSTKLIRENQAIFVEDLAVKDMVRNRKLSRSISDAAWSEFVRQLEYKAEWYGRAFAKVDRWLPSSKMCSDCGHVLDSLPLDVRSWRCPVCASDHDRDVNAARNIRAAGLAAPACGGDVSLMDNPMSVSSPGEAGTYASDG
jgi:putative transposase